LFGILFCLESDDLPEDLVRQLKLKKIPLKLLTSYFRLFHILKLTSEEGKKTIEDYLLVNIPTEF
jgi:hypothetical protein